MTPEDAYRAAKALPTGERILGWSLNRAERAELLKRFPPRYGHAVADHVTLAAKVSKDAPLPGEVEAAIVGESDDGDGVQAMVVRIGETTDRPDGSTYHITWSLDRDKGRRAVESNDVIGGRGWTPIEPPVPVMLVPATF